MRSNFFYSLLLVVATMTTLLSTIFLFKPKYSNDPKFISQNVNDYLGPRSTKKGNTQLVRVQVMVSDDPNPQGAQILEAEFNQQAIPLKPRDIFGFRGQASFQTAPGKYKLKWKVKRDKLDWPRTLSHEEEVTLDPRDLWIQITITGESASIS